MVEKYPVTPDEIVSSFKLYQNDIASEKKVAALCMAFIQGHQQRIWHESETRYTPIYRNKVSRQVYEFVTNLLIDPYRSLVYQLITKDASPEVVPTENDEELVELSEYFNKGMEYLLNQVWDISEKNEQWAMWGLQNGTCYSEIYPEATTETYEYVEADGKKYPEFTPNPDGTFVVEGKTVSGERKSKTGVRLQCDVRTMWDIAHSRDGKYGKADDASWHTIKSRRTIGYIRSQFGEKAANALELPDETPSLRDAFSDDLTDAIRGTSPMTVALKGDDREVFVYSRFHKPTPENKRGYCMVVAEGRKSVVLKYEDKLPLSNKHYSVMPLRQLDTFTSCPGRHVQTPVFNLVIGIQVLYNAVMNALAKHAQLAAAPPITRIKGVTTDKDGLYPTFGSVIQVDFQNVLKDAVMANPSLGNLLEPKFFAIPQMNSSVQEMLVRCETAVINVIGTNMANPGQLPNPELSGVSANVQASLDMMGQAPLIKKWQSFKHGLYLDALKAMTCIYDKTELAYILGVDDAEIKGLYENSVSDSFDIQFADLAGMPSSPTGKLQYLTNLKGTLSQEFWPRIDRLILNVVAGIGVNIGVNDNEQALAEKENEYLDESEDVFMAFKNNDPSLVIGMVNPLQDDDVHIATHKEDIVSPRALKLGPERMAIRVAHIRAHEESKTTKMAGQVALQNQLAPPPPPSQQSDKQPGMNVNIGAEQPNQQQPTY